MLKRTAVEFAGYTCVKLENDTLALWVTQSVGPRIIGLALQGGDNLLVQLPDLKIDCPGEGVYSFRGGHRLWYAPEDPWRSYLPDETPVTITDVEGGIQVVQPVESQTGIQKSMIITLPDEGGRVVIDHRLENLGDAPIELAPWAITQLRPGGVGILPQPRAQVDEAGLLPNRHLVLWPYTEINSPHVTWGDRYIFISADLAEGAFKVGYPNPLGWMGYAVDDVLFVKSAAYQTAAYYYDRGCSTECYCGPLFLEAETLGPRTVLASGESVTHREEWRLFSGVLRPSDKDAMQELAEELDLNAR